MILALSKIQPDIEKLSQSVVQQVYIAADKIFIENYNFGKEFFTFYIY